jgi:NTE family protein
MKRAALVLAVALGLAGCASTRPWINAPLPPLARGEVDAPAPAWSALDEERMSVYGVLALSGGGARAAAFGYGVMQELKATRIAWHGRDSTVLDEIDTVHGVSGGSIVAAYWAAFGDATFPAFEQEFLRQDFQRSLVVRSLRPDNTWRMTSPWFGRSHLLAQRLDELFRGVTFGQMQARAGAPQLLVSATDLTLGTPFEFSPEQFALICSDLAGVPLSFAVAASSAVPLLLSPMTLQNHAGHCPRPLPEPDVVVGVHGHQSQLLVSQAQSYVDAEQRPYIHLVDGGVADNLGVRRPLEKVIAEGGLVRAGTAGGPRHAVHRLFIIAVNSEREPGYRIDLSDRTPDTMQVLDSLLFGSGGQGTRETLALLRHAIRSWQQEMQARGHESEGLFAPDLQLFLVTVNLRDLPGHEGRALLRVPTAFTIGDDDVTRLIAAGREALRASPDFRALVASLGGAATASPTPPPAAGSP